MGPSPSPARWRRCTRAASGRLRTSTVKPDPKESTRYLAAIAQDGFGGGTLGLPDRDYYFLDDAKIEGEPRGVP